jgi:predicted phosphodiesterase
MIKTCVDVHDLHYPKMHKPTVDAILDFCRRNKIAQFVFGGDQLDFECISHHTKGKGLYRQPDAYANDLEGFDRDVLTPLETLLGKTCEKYWIIGNHERFEHDVIEEHPELRGTLDHVKILRLKERGWTIIPLGHCVKIGKLRVIHGETLSGIGNQAGNFPAKKAVELYAASVLAGHTHAPQTFTRVSPVEYNDKWQGHISPIAGAVNPGYLRNRATAWLNGFNVIELFPNGNFNYYPLIVIGGQAAYGGKIYGKSVRDSGKKVHGCS